MVMAGLLNPPESGKSAMDYATDNFSFCTQKTIQDVLKMAFAPLYAVAGQQTSVMGSLASPMNNLRGLLKKGAKSFARLMDNQMRRYNLINASIIKTWNHLLFSFGRIQTIFYGIVYFGLSMNAMIQNTLDVTFKSITIFIGIMVAMIILLFFVLFPFIPLILTTITVLVAAGVGGAAGMAGAFCIHPDATVGLEDGSMKALREIKLGDRLISESGSENRVTGILEVDATTTPLVSIEGILMSESHRIKINDTWILAKDHPNAKIEPYTRLPRLICLNTTAHEVILETESGTLCAGDWEEVTDEEGRKAWIDVVHLSLNSIQSQTNKYPTAVPLVSAETCVHHEYKNKIPIGSVCIGDSILSSNGKYTRVIGLYKGQFKCSKAAVNPDWISDGVWIHERGETWTTAASMASGLREDEEGQILEGVFLVTEDEQFMIWQDGKHVLVRDFTEIGAGQIDQTYEMLDAHMNKK
jgi:hypothetical protein